VEQIERCHRLDIPVTITSVMMSLNDDRMDGLARVVVKKIADLVLVATLLVPAGIVAAEDKLLFTAIPDQNATELKEKYDPVAAYLESQLGVEVEYVPAIDYQASVAMFTNGDVQLAWFGGLTGMQARQAVPGARAIAQGVEDERYHSYFIAHASTGLELSEDFPTAIAGFPFAFGSESSTSGRLMPEYFIEQKTGMSVQEFFREPYGFSGSHAKTAELVQEGTRVKVGVLNYKVYDQMVETGRIDPEVCRKIWSTPLYVDYNFTAHPVLEVRYGAGFTDRLQMTLVQMDDPKLLTAFQRTQLIEARNEQYNELAKVARELGMLR
jgi:phosphonate transport system substrate-binding protein